MPASPRHRALQPPRSTSRDCRRSATEVCALLMRQFCHFLRARGVALAVVPLWRAAPDPLDFSGDKRGRSKALFLAVLDGTSSPDPEPVDFSCDPENWAYGRIPSESTAKDIISALLSFLLVLR